MEQCRQGNRQNGSVTSGKGLSMRAGHGGPSPEPVGCGGLLELLPRRRGRRVPAGGRTGNGSSGGLPRASNSRLRTGSQMPRHLISDAHEWINEIPTVPVYYPAKPRQGNGLAESAGKEDLLSLTLVRLCEMT
ncbi:hypothetical protein Dsin_032712 [Dipteronia sinensis]|uniref:Uncharacterized protein n=1 Tax=Dipteronia sinensis TaxID=43782 RepID=A0AAE0DN01_9ROSI|nr:hypothetical protein Dsin_032712 [Dipteronia sinensis]